MERQCPACGDYHTGRDQCKLPRYEPCLSDAPGGRIIITLILISVAIGVVSALVIP